MRSITRYGCPNRTSISSTERRSRRVACLVMSAAMMLSNPSISCTGVRSSGGSTCETKGIVLKVPCSY